MAVNRMQARIVMTTASAGIMRDSDETCSVTSCRRTRERRVFAPDAVSKRFLTRSMVLLKPKIAPWQRNRVLPKLI
jgi:hypothetical protein